MELMVSMTVAEFTNLLRAEVKKCIGEFKPVKETRSNDEIMTRSEAAAALKISLPTLSALSKEGVIPSHRLGGRVLYKASEVAMSLTKVHAR
jgi:excisionase family DNA binding protein